MIEISFLCLKILSIADSRAAADAKAADKVKAFLAHAELGFGFARRAGSYSRASSAHCQVQLPIFLLLSFLYNPTAVALLGRSVVSSNPDQSPWSKPSPAGPELPVHAGRELLAGNGLAVLVR